METTLTNDPALAAYEGLAPFYDVFTRTHRHDRWLENLEAIAIEHGLEGRRVLDVACGTGKSFVPLLRRGYEVVGCDISPAMVEEAQRRLGPSSRARVLVADVRSLPQLGTFDLATSISDALNYLLSDGELRLAFEGVARNLGRGGMFVFDLNTLATYRRIFARDIVTETDDAVFLWRGEGDADPQPGCTASARVEVFAAGGNNCWRRTTTVHVQRHHPPTLVRSALADAGLELVLVHGQMSANEIEPDFDDDHHVKFVYLARKA